MKVLDQCGICGELVDQCGILGGDILNESVRPVWDSVRMSRM